MTELDDALESSGAAIHDEIGSRPAPDPAWIAGRNRTRRRRRRTGSVIVVVGVLFAGVFALDQQSDPVPTDVADVSTSTPSNVPVDPAPSLAASAEQKLEDAIQCILGAGVDLTIEDTQINSQTAQIIIITSTSERDWEHPVSIASQCGDRHGVVIETRVDGGATLDEPAFSGPGWDLIVGEGPNGDSGTYKVCHTIVPAGTYGEMQSEDLGSSGCGDWPSITDPDVVIATVFPLAYLDDTIVILVDLGTVAVDQVTVNSPGQESAAIAPFVMPQSGKQFAAFEISNDVESIVIEAFGPDQTLLDTYSLDFARTTSDSEPAIGA